MTNGVKVVVWRDVLIVIDDGRSRVEDYRELAAIAQELHATYPAGWGLMTVIPQNAVPPPDDVRAAMNDAVYSVQDSVKAAVWCVEADGFTGAMARAVLTGLRFLSKAPYARHSCTTIEESFTWLLPRLPGGRARLDELSRALAYVRARRTFLKT